MTCTTHHICDCQRERMEKLEDVYFAAKCAIKDADPMFRTTAMLEDAVAALEDLK